MKNIKIFLSAMVVCVMSYGSYTAYQAATITAEEKALMENVEALANNENGNAGVVFGYCGNSLQYICLKVCPQCGAIYTANSGIKAPARNVFGSCSCGHNF